MAIWKKVTLGLAAVAVLAAGAFLWFVQSLSSAFEGMCGNQVLAEFPSPNGQVKAVIFERNCGTTTDFSTQVSILSSGELLENEGGNLFVADTDHGRAPSGVGGGPEVRFRWVSDAEAEIFHHPAARVYKSSTSLRGMRVSYVAFPSRDR